jgi:lipopolysaccharide biosynthesis protein
LAEKNRSMKRICFFSSYFESKEIPYYIQYYLRELARHCETIVFIANEKQVSPESTSYLESLQIEMLQVVNEGFDFGMWAKAIPKYPVEEYDQLLLVNDSCVLFKPIDSAIQRISQADWDYCGILDALQVDYHIQSYFIVVRRIAYPLLKEYFNTHRILPTIEEVIRVYEVGLTQYMLANNMKVGAVYSHAVCHPDLNPAYSGIERLIEDGFPMIKRKIVFSTYREQERLDLVRIGFNIDAAHYLRLLKKAIAGDPDAIDLEHLREDGAFRVGNLWYRIYAALFRSARRVPFVREIYRSLKSDRRAE